MKTYHTLLLALLLAGCAGSRPRGVTILRNAADAAEAAKKTYGQQQQPRPAETFPRYRRVTITLPAHVEDGVRYEEQTRTLLIAQ